MTRHKAQQCAGNKKAFPFENPANAPDLMAIVNGPWLFGLILIGFAAIFASIGAVMLYEALLGGVFAFLTVGTTFAAFIFWWSVAERVSPIITWLEAANA